MAPQNPPSFQQADSYSAQSTRLPFSTFINSGGGVVGNGDLAVTALSTPNMSVNVAAGQIWIPGTFSGYSYQGQYYGLNNGTYNVLIPGSDPTNPRIDLIVAQVLDSAYGSASSEWQIVDIEGTPASSPTIPTAPASSIVLAQIAVSAAVSTITSSDITDVRTFAKQVSRVEDLGGQVYNVKAYGAKGDGVTDDTAAINALATLIAATPGGVMYFPPGTYISNDGKTPAQSTGYIKIVGAGKNSTVLQASQAVGNVFTLQMPGEVTDMTVDGNALTTYALVLLTSGTIAISEMALRRVKCKNPSTSGQMVLMVWDQGALFQIDRLYLDDVEIEGPSNVASDSLAISFVNNVFVNNLSLKNLARTPNFYVIKKLFIDGCDVENCGSSDGLALVIDGGVQYAYIENIHIDTTGALLINAPECKVTNGSFFYGVTANEGNNNPRLSFVNCYSANISLNNAVDVLEIIGGEWGYNNAVIIDTSPSGSTHNIVSLSDVVLSPQTTGQIFRSFNGTTVNELRVNNCHGWIIGRELQDGSLTSASDVLTSQSGAFTASDVGRKIYDFAGAIPSGTTISSVTNSTTVVMSANATSTQTSDDITLEGYAQSLDNYNVTLGSKSRISGTTGFNPVGLVTVAVPATGVATGILPYDCMFYITASTSTVACAVTDSAGTSQTVATIPASGFAGVLVPAGSTLTPTYTAAPTWTVQGN